MKKKYIVAEISKTWPSEGEDGKPLLHFKFEQVIDINLQKGYLLDDWKLSHLYYEWIEPSGHVIGIVQETIIAIFKLKE